MDLKRVENNSILVIPNNIRGQVINYINNSNNLLNIKVMTFNDIKRSLYFSYDEEAVLYIMDKYKVKYGIARTYLENIYYTYGKKIDSPKFKFLYNLKEELIANDLLIIDKYFSLFFNRKFYIYGYNHIDKFYLNMLESIPNVEIIDMPKYKEKELEVIEFNRIEEECEYVIRKICSLIDSGVDINDIKIKIDESYINELKRLSMLYNLPINFKNTSSIYSTKIAKEYLRLLREGLSFEEVIDDIKSKFNDTYIIKKLIDLSNKYVGLNYDRELIVDSIIYNLKNISTSIKEFNKAIEIVNLDNNDLKDKYVFVLGLNEGVTPKSFKDEEYFSDLELKELGLDTSTNKNVNAKLNLINTIYGIDNLYLSYSLSNTDGELYPSSIISTYNIEVKHTNMGRSVSYSTLSDKIYYASLLDNYTKYKEISDDLILFNSNYNISYKTYDNKFNGIDNNKLLAYIKKLTLSYSAMDNYYRCGFRYYIENTLKLNAYQDTFSIFIGNLFHYILSICNNLDFDFEKEWDKYLIKRELRVDEGIFLIKLKEELKFIINYLYRFNKDTGLNNMYLEKKITIDKSSTIPVEFKGFVDKIMYRDNLVSIIDYKTGNAQINLNNSIYGIGMQLPIYLYLVMKSNIFNSPKIIGIYLQKILNNNKTITDKEASLKLVGYSTNDEGCLSIFDPTYENSSYIKGMKKKKDGFYSYTKLLTEKEINSLYKLTDEKINDAVNSILKGDFSINPKRIGKENVGCSFCKYKDLCFMKEEDIINLEEVALNLGGEEDA